MQTLNKVLSSKKSNADGAAIRDEIHKVFFLDRKEPYIETDEAILEIEDKRTVTKHRNTFSGYKAE